MLKQDGHCSELGKSLFQLSHSPKYTHSHTHTHRDEGMEEVKERERVGMDGGGGESDPRDHGGRKREETRIGYVGLEGSPSRLE